MLKKPKILISLQNTTNLLLYKMGHTPYKPGPKGANPLTVLVNEKTKFDATPKTGISIYYLNNH